MAVKLIAMDLDGTLLNRQKMISPENQRALEDASARGVILVAATGRAWGTIPACVRENPVFSYTIASNGAEIYSHATGCCMYSDRLSPSGVEAIQSVMETERAGCEVFIRGKAYGEENFVSRPWEYGVPSASIGYIKKTRIPVSDMGAFIRENKENISVIDLVTGDAAAAERLFRKLENCGEPLYMTASMDGRLEILSPRAGKGAGLAALCQLLDIAPADTAAFGDADNDLDMLRFAGVGIAMGNAWDSVLEEADYVTCDNEHHGVAGAIRKRLGILPPEEIRQHEKFMREAIRQANKAAALEEVPIGCVIVKDGQIISRGYNRRNTDNNTLSHAELNAIRKASGKLGDWRLEGCTMYITLEPCQMCAGALVQSRIDRIVLGGKNPKAGCAGSVLNLLQVDAFNHQVEIVEGILTEECSSLLTDFFRQLREQKKSQS